MRREAINQILWGRESRYLPGGGVFERGLFECEQRVITEPPFPQAGRILLGGAGGGRELLELCRRGYDVVAFEPSDLCEGARQVVSSFPNSAVIRASYRDLVTAVQEHAGPLAAHVLNASFDAVIFGWGSFYFVFADERREVLRAARTAAPEGPLLLSYGEQQDAENGRLDRLRPIIRLICKMLGAPSARVPGDLFRFGFGHIGFQDDLKDLAEASGYRVLYRRASGAPSPYAMLMPQ